MAQQSILNFFGGSTRTVAKSNKRPRSPALASPKGHKIAKLELDIKQDIKQDIEQDIKQDSRESAFAHEANVEPEAPSSAGKKSGANSSPPGSPGSESGELSASKASELIELTEKAPHVLSSKCSKIPYAKLTSVLEMVEKESGRLKMTAIISEFFLEVLNQFKSPRQLTYVVYLLINRLGPDYEPDLELGLGETLLIKAISECYGRPLAKIKKDYHEVGDLGLVAQKSRLGQPPMFKPAPLDIEQVFNNLTSIAKSTGKDSQTRKIAIINKMLTSCDMKSSEAKFLIRSLEGKLRIGLAEKTVLVGIAQAFVHYENPTNKRVQPEALSKAEEIIREAFSLVPNYEVIIQNCFDHGIANLLEHCQLTAGIPLKPMLAKPTKSIGEVLDRFLGEEFTCEYKYDGERAQVHLLDTGEVRIYSRNSEDMSQRYPDLVAIVKDFIKQNGQQENGKRPKSLILDCEAVAWDRQTNKILPFQVLSTRKRKDVNEADIKVHICLFAFDLLCYNGESLITQSFHQRRQTLFENFAPIEGKFDFATHKDSSDLNELQLFLDQSVKDSCEGLMVKMLHGKDSFYEPSKRSRNWLKLKKDYLAGVGDSLDLVVIGAYVGKGKRTGSYGGFLLAAYNDDTGEYESTCKIGTGFSDEDLVSLHQRLKPHEMLEPKPFYVYDASNSNARPDVWLEPTSVFEVLTADLSLSPIYKAAHSEYGKGISLRFPRFIRLREDKGVEDATTSTQVSEFYQRQANLN